MIIMRLYGGINRLHLSSATACTVVGGGLLAPTLTDSLVKCVRRDVYKLNTRRCVVSDFAVGSHLHSGSYWEKCTVRDNFAIISKLELLLPRDIPTRASPLQSGGPR